MGRFFFTVLAALAALERDLISERTSMAMRHIAANGGYTGGHVPFGFWRSPGSGQVVTDPDEQRVIAMIRRLHDGGQNAPSIARTLNGAFVPCRGSAWHAKTVSRVIGRKA